MYEMANLILTDIDKNNLYNKLLRLYGDKITGLLMLIVLIYETLILILFFKLNYLLFLSN